MHIRQAITTKFLGPTDCRGARIVAKAAAGRRTYEWNYALGIEENHALAAQRLAEKLRWHGTWYGGGLPADDGYVFVLAESDGNAHAFAIVHTMEDIR